MTEQAESTESYDYYDGLSLTDCILHMHALRQLIDEHEDKAKQLKKRHDFLSKSKIPSMMEDEGLEQMVVTGVGRINLRSDVYVSIPAENKQEAWQWLRDNGRESLISETVNASSLKASVRQGMKSGDVFPEDVFKITPYTMAVITKKS